MSQYDLLVIGGGINGAAVARDAAGRGLSVLLVEKDDLASHTSSASSKLIHGGLRYLERYEFRLVRESLGEREVLLRTAPHLVRPQRFILPNPPGGRPWWMIRTGLLLYDALAGRSSLPRSGGVSRSDPARAALAGGSFKLASYWDAWVDDSRLVVLNAVDAAERGAEIATRTELLSAERSDDHWRATLSDERKITARMIVNAAGPWVAEVLAGRLRRTNAAPVRLVKGSHILVPQLWDGDHGYILPQPDGRVVFALPYRDLTMIGTTDVPVDTPEAAQVSAEEVEYLCAASNRFLQREIGPADVVHSFAGIRALYDDGAASAKDVTRDYHLELEAAPGPKLLSVFGGKITTARALAAEVLDRLGVGGLKFTRTSPLPGGDMLPDFNEELAAIGRWMPADMLRRMAEAYGTRLNRVIGDAKSLSELGRHFGGGLYEAEVQYLCAKEFARTAEDISWRRTKLGLRLDSSEQQDLADYLASTPRT